MSKIVGNIVGLPSPRSDWNQTNETKADFIKNKPTKLSQFENDSQFVDNTTYVTDQQYFDGRVTQNEDDIAELKESVESIENGYYTKEETDAVFVKDEVYANDMQTYDQLVYQNVDDIAEIKESLGDIDTALDAILAIQSELIGG